MHQSLYFSGSHLEIIMLKTTVIVVMGRLLLLLRGQVSSFCDFRSQLERVNTVTNCYCEHAKISDKVCSEMD